MRNVAQLVAEMASVLTEVAIAIEGAPARGVGQVGLLWVLLLLLLLLL